MGTELEMSQTVQVCAIELGEGRGEGKRGGRTVSMEEVTMCVGSRVDHEKEVSGAE